jgi:uncharacterized membrane protein
VSERALRIAIAAVCVAGLGIAGYLTVTEASGDLPQCVAGGGGCETVAQSSYAELLGIKVAYLGLGGYVLIGATALLRGDAGRLSGAALALTGFGFSAYLTYLELFVIDAICQYCVASAIAMTVLMVLTMIRLLRYGGTRPGSVPS